MSRAILMAPNDTVATLLDSVKAGEDVTLSDGRSIKAAEDIRAYFKIAVTSIPKGDGVMKYGQTIGQSIAGIKTGEMVHTHNLLSNRARASRDLRKSIGN